MKYILRKWVNAAYRKQLKAITKGKEPDFTEGKRRTEIATRYYEKINRKNEHFNLGISGKSRTVKL